MAELRLKELYRSIQGESTFAGWPCVFVRTAGCDIRCVYCDEAHAFTGGERLSSDEILQRVAELRTKLVEVNRRQAPGPKRTTQLRCPPLHTGDRSLVENRRQPGK